MDQQKRLYRSRTEKMIAGVCGGIARYFDIDPTIIRVIWVAATLLAGSGVLAYLILWVVVQLEPVPPTYPPTYPPDRQY